MYAIRKASAIPQIVSTNVYLTVYSKLIYLHSICEVVYVMKTTGELLIYFTFGCILVFSSGFAVSALCLGSA